MPRHCTVCGRDLVDAALRAGVGSREIARRFGVGEAAVRRHSTHHLKAMPALPTPASEPHPSDPSDPSDQPSDGLTNRGFLIRRRHVVTTDGSNPSSGVEKNESNPSLTDRSPEKATQENETTQDGGTGRDVSGSETEGEAESASYKKNQSFGLFPAPAPVPRPRFVVPGHEPPGHVLVDEVVEAVVEAVVERDHAHDAPAAPVAPERSAPVTREQALAAQLVVYERNHPGRAPVDQAAATAARERAPSVADFFHGIGRPPPPSQFDK